MIKIHYVSGSRADFGLMRRCLIEIDKCSSIDLKLIITAQHTSKDYGDTISEICDSGLSIAHQVPVSLSGANGSEMAMAMATELAGFTDIWSIDPPDIVLLLGDRGEMVAAALSAVHLGIFVAHIHGGERSGTIDESFRHVITKLAHFHFPATEDAALRIKSMGENPRNINVIGAPGIEGIVNVSGTNIDELNISMDKPLALILFHPVVQELDEIVSQCHALTKAVLSKGYFALIFRPNADAGGAGINNYLDGLSENLPIKIVTHLERALYLKALSSCKLILGNSSSGIIESASFDVPCINIGSRQDMRLRNNNTIDIKTVGFEEICKAIDVATRLKPPFHNKYGDGKTSLRLCRHLTRLNLNKKFLKKSNTY